MSFQDLIFTNSLYACLGSIFLSKYFFILQFLIDEKNELIEFKNINMLMLREQGRRLSVGYAGVYF